MSDIPYLLERVGPAAVVQLHAEAFARLPLRDKHLAWHLYEAALAGRDIYFDQRYEHSLLMRQVIEALFVGRACLDPAVADAIAGDLADPRPEPGTVDPARITAADPAWAGGGRSGGS